MRLRRYAACLLGAVTISASLLTIGQSAGAAAKKAPIVIGDVCSCTGPEASSVAQTSPSLEAWAKYVTAHGGIQGHPVQLIVKDDGYNPTTSLADVQTLVTADHVVALFDNSDVDSSWTSYVAAHDVPVIARVETTDRIRTGRVLDLGANGIMFPRVDNGEQATSAASNLRYPPNGQRGVATYNRSCGFGSHPEVLETADESVLCVVQIESVSALNDVEAIARAPGVDVLFIGPRDLTQALGCPGEVSSAIFLEATARVLRAAANAGVSTGILVSRPEDLAGYIEQGFSFVAVGSDSSMLASTAAAAVSSARSHSGDIKRGSQ